MILAICDDERGVREYIAACAFAVSDDLEIRQYEDASGILDPGFDADVLVLDIEMPGINGMDAAGSLRKKGNRSVIIFVTAAEEYVYRAFDVGASGYVVKPFDPSRLKEVLKRALQLAEERRDSEDLSGTKEDDSVRFITVNSGGTHINVRVSDIRYAEVFNRQIVLHKTDGTTVEYYGRMKELEGMLGEDFFRVHRAYLIHLPFLRSYDSRTVCMGGDRIPVARGKYQDLVRAFLAFRTRKEGM